MLISIVYWLAVVLYAFSSVLFIAGPIFSKRHMTMLALRAVAAGFVAHTAVATFRWLETGHPPFVSYFEAMSASAWFAIGGFLLFQQRRAFVRNSGAGVMVLATFLMGWSGTHPFGDDVLPVSLQSFWLFIHASFATAAVGCFLVAAGVAAHQLFRDGPSPHQEDEPGTMSARQEEFIARLILFGFILYGLMIVSGSIWADAAWGRYWGWDPIELWSLITWLLYAVYLHLYFMVRRLRGKFLLWFAFTAVFVAGFSLWGVSFVYSTLHTYSG